MAAPPQIPQCDPRASYLAQKEDIDAAISKVLMQGRYILGEEVAAFEAELSAFLGVSGAVGVANGTDALELALRALGVGPGDAVITVSHTAVATAVAIRKTGAAPLFADVDPVHGLIDPEHVSALLRAGPATGRVRAIVPVHLYGRCADMDAITDTATRHGLHVVEDCAQAHGAEFRGRRAGSFGAFGTFSFYPTKNLGAIGDGGALVTSDEELAQRVRLLREYGWKTRYVSAIEGGNSRLDELQAAILRAKLHTLGADNDRRRRIAHAYLSAIKNPDIILPAGEVGPRHVYHQFTVRCADRDGLQAHLREAGVGTLVHYPVPVHLQPAYSGKDYTPLPLPRTEAWARDVLSLPMYPQLGDDAVERVVDAVNAWRRPGT